MLDTLVCKNQLAPEWHLATKREKTIICKVKLQGFLQLLCRSAVSISIHSVSSENYNQGWI